MLSQKHFIFSIYIFVYKRKLTKNSVFSRKFNKNARIGTSETLKLFEYAFSHKNHDNIKFIRGHAINNEIPNNCLFP